MVIIQGYSVCPDERLNNVKSIWTAKIIGDKVEEWRIWLDSKENRKKLDIK